MAVTTVTSSGSACFPYVTCLDSNDIPYILVYDGSNLKVFKGNASNPSSWSSQTVGDGTIANGSAPNLAHMAVGVYDSTEYIWVVRVNSSGDLVLDRSTIAAFSFPSGNTITIDDTYAFDNTRLGCDYGESRLFVHYRSDGSNGYRARMSYSTNGGTSWSTPTLTWDDSGSSNKIGHASVVWDGSYWHLMAGRQADSWSAYTKRWSSGSGLQRWNGTSWVSASATDAGYDTGSELWAGGSGHAAASSNIIVFGHGEGSTSNNHANVIYSEDGGQSWAEVPGMGSGGYCKTPSITLKTEAGEVDDFHVWAGNYTSNSNDTNKKTYDFSGSSFGGWTLIWDSGDTDDIVQYFAGLLLQINGWVYFGYQWYDSSETTYYVRFNVFEEGSTGATYTKTYTADLFLKAVGLTKTYTADMLLKLIATKTYDVDTILKLIATKTYTADLLLRDTLTKNYQADVLLKALGLTQTYQVDLILMAVLTKTYSADLLLKAFGLTTTYTADVILGTAEYQTFTKTYVADLILWQKTAFSQNTPVFTRDDKIITQNAPIFTRRT